MIKDATKLFTNFRNENTRKWNKAHLKELAKLKPEDRNLVIEFQKGRASALDEVIESMESVIENGGDCANLLQSFQKWRDRTPVK